MTMLKNTLKILLKIFACIPVLIIIYVITFVFTCYRPTDSAVLSLKNHFVLNNIKFEPGTNSSFYSEPNYYGNCGIKVMAKVRLVEGSKPKFLIYKLHRSWFFGSWDIVDVSDYKPDPNVPKTKIEDP